MTAIYNATCSIQVNGITNGRRHATHIERQPTESMSFIHVAFCSGRNNQAVVVAATGDGDERAISVGLFR